jgi:hypothetical protein
MAAARRLAKPLLVCRVPDSLSPQMRAEPPPTAVTALTLLVELRIVGEIRAKQASGVLAISGRGMPCAGWLFAMAALGGALLEVGSVGVATR